jgi:nucleotide-binding universal stress UspA family protein
MKKILFPTDFSKAAENAFLNALTIAKKIEAELILLHIYELPELGRSLKTTTKEIYEMMEMEALEAFQVETKKLRKIAEDHHLGDVVFSQEMMEGDPITKIIYATHKFDIDLIVMGTKGATGLKEIFLGSIASGVIDASPVNVMCIPSSTNHENQIERIAYLTNYKDEEVEAFQKVVDYANLFNAEVLCVHYDGDESCVNGEEMEAWKKKVDFSNARINYHVIKGADFEKALIEFNESAKIDILSVQPRKKNIFARLFKKSVSKTIAHHLDIPLFTLPKK